MEEEQKKEENKKRGFVEEAAFIRKQARERFIGYISAALALVAGLAWNDAIGTLIKVLNPLEQNTLVAKFIYAIAITVFITLIIASLERLLRDKEENK